MLIRDVMTRSVVAVTPQTSVLNARRLLASHRIRHLPVVVGDEVVGMVSDRDIRIDQDLGRTLRSLQSDLVSGRYRRVDTVMSAPAHVTAPTETVEAAADYMVSRRIGALPVVEQGRLVGIVGLTDCVRALLQRLAAERRATVADVDSVRLEPNPPVPA